MSLRHTINQHLQSLEKKFQTLNRLEISRSAILHNFDLFEQLSPGTIIPVLKSNAYGHGLQTIADILRDRTFPYIAVDGYFEALEIREVTNQPLLVMGYILPANFAQIDCSAFTFVVHDLPTLEALGTTKHPVKIHLELETGMNRMGVKSADLAHFLEELRSYPTITLEGVMTHLADADNPDPAFTTQQTQVFDAGVDTVLAAGFQPTLFHIAQSAGSTKVTSRHANALRVGISLYGVSPLTHDDPEETKLADLQPALTAISTITKVQNLAPGEHISYGLTHTASRPMRIGIIPFGYYEGLPRALSNKGCALHNGEVLPIVGRICMNHTLVDLTESQADWGDEVTVISANPKDQNSIARICEDFELFNYGLLVGLNQTVRRIIVE